MPKRIVSASQNLGHPHFKVSHTHCHSNGSWEIPKGQGLAVRVFYNRRVCKEVTGNGTVLKDVVFLLSKDKKREKGRVTFSALLWKRIKVILGCSFCSVIKKNKQVYCICWKPPAKRYVASKIHLKISKHLNRCWIPSSYKYNHNKTLIIFVLCSEYKSTAVKVL